MLTADAPSGLPLGNPLDFLAADHGALRSICADLTALVNEGAIGCARTDALRGYLREGLADHLADEEMDLFPLLREKTHADADTVSVLDRLLEDHVELRVRVRGVLAGLNRVMETQGVLTRQEADACAAFSALKLRHVIIETAILLPIARGVLSVCDLQILSDRMLSRRGLDRLMVRADAG